MIRPIIIKKLALIVLLFIFIALDRQGLLDLDLKVYDYLFLILLNFLIAFCMSYIFVSMVLLYRVVSSEEFQHDDTIDLGEELSDSQMEDSDTSAVTPELKTWEKR